MLALIRERKKILIRLFFLLTILSALGGCATQKDPPRLVNDPSVKPESVLPWNKQEKWEVGTGFPSQMGEGR